MHLIFEQIRTGGDRNFGYLLGDRDAKQAVLIDPSYSPEALAQRAVDQELAVATIINTHGHEDHINGNDKAMELTHARLAAHPQCPVPANLRLNDRQELSIGGLCLIFFHTPGHCEDHLVIYEKVHQLLISGDLLFVGKVGGTKDRIDSRLEWNSLQQLLQTLPDSATVWPGHDYGVRPSSTIGIERRTNPFLLCPDLQEFDRLKDDWPIHKKRYGLK